MTSRCWSCGGPHRASQRPDCLEKLRDYFSRPEVRERTITYKNTQRYREWCAAYRQRPEVRARALERNRTAEAKQRKRLYNQRPEVKERARNKSKLRYARPEIKEWHHEYRRRPQVQERRQRYRIEYLKRPGKLEENRMYQREWMKRYSKKEGVAEKKKVYFQRPEVRARRTALARFRRWREGAMPRKKTGIERRLGGLLNKHFPRDWKYTGQGQVVIGRKVPDYININGKKEIIELHGCYYHGCISCGFRDSKFANELRDSKRIRTFTEFGYRTLVIWEHELGVPDAVVKRITSEFYPGRGRTE